MIRSMTHPLEINGQVNLFTSSHQPMAPASKEISVLYGIESIWHALSSISCWGAQERLSCQNAHTVDLSWSALQLGHWLCAPCPHTTS